MPTSITLDGDVKERLKAYRDVEHDNWGDTIGVILDALPTPAEIREEGCTYSGCEHNFFVPDDADISEIGGVVQWFSVEYEDHTLTSADWFCSAGCAQKTQERVNDLAGHDPDRVLVGGRNQPRAELTDADFYIDGERREVGIDVPGAFAGQDSHGGEYIYIGEPVEVYNRGRVVQSGDIEEVIHEDGHTALILD